MKSVGGKSSAGGSGGMSSTGSTSGSQSLPGTASNLAISSEPQQLIHDLLEALTTLKDDPESGAGVAVTPGAEGTNTTPTEERNTNTGATVRRQLHLSRSSSANDMVVQEVDEQVMSRFLLYTP